MKTDSQIWKPDLLTINELAALFRVHVDTIKAWHRFHGLELIRQGPPPRGRLMAERSVALAWHAQFCRPLRLSKPSIVRVRRLAAK